MDKISILARFLHDTSTKNKYRLIKKLKMMRFLSDTKYMTYPLCDVKEINRISLEYGSRGLVRGHIACFEDFVAPYDSELIREAHCADQRIVYHTCGGMMPILDFTSRKQRQNGFPLPVCNYNRHPGSIFC